MDGWILKKKNRKIDESDGVGRNTWVGLVDGDGVRKANNKKQYDDGWFEYVGSDR